MNYYTLYINADACDLLLLNLQQNAQRFKGS